MNNQQLNNLTNIEREKNTLSTGYTYHYNVKLPITKYAAKFYRPVFSEKGIVFDYYKVAKKYLKDEANINAESAQSLFFYSRFDGDAKRISLCQLTPEKAQSLINRNITLFAQIANKIIENKLISDINSI